MCQNNEFVPDRALNVSQNTNRLDEPTRVLNSQKNSPRHNASMIVNDAVRKSMRETSSYLDTSYNSLGMPVNDKESTAFTDRRKTAVNKSAAFGFSFYKTPNCCFFKDAIKLSKISPSKREHFLTKHCKNKSFVPSPDKYEVSGSLNMGDPKKRVFSKLPRLTMAEEIIKKGALTPGPGTYRLDYKRKRKDSHKMTSVRELGFINEAKVKGKENPLSFDSKFALVETKPRFTNFRLSTVERSVRIEKKPGLSPCSYDPLIAFKKTQLFPHTAKFSKSRIAAFSDVVAKLKKFVPPPGQYDFEKCEAKLYKPFSRKRR